MPIAFEGKTYPLVAQDRMTLEEVAAIERKIGMSFPKLRFRADTCVCEHGSKQHQHFDEAGAASQDTSCTVCACQQHVSDLPMEQTTAFVWVSIRRFVPTVKYEDVANTAITDLLVEDAEVEDEAPDPTTPSPEASTT